MADSTANGNSDAKVIEFPGRIYFDLKFDHRDELEPKIVTDYTFEIDATSNEAKSLLPDIHDAAGALHPIASRPLRAKIKVSLPNLVDNKPQGTEDPELSLQCRALVCKSRGNDFLSVTVRVDDGGAKAAEQEIKAWMKTNHAKGYIQDSRFTASGRKQFAYEREYNDGKPSTVGMSAYKAAEKRTTEQPVAIADIVEQLHRDVFFPIRPDSSGDDSGPKSDQLHGAVLIAGRTKSAKSLIARGFIHRFLTHKATYNSLAALHGRRPHLVTCEDPIEVYFRAPVNQLEAVPPLIDYTPRDKTEKDYLELEQAFQDALRQTPACLFVGEARGEKDLRELLEFAGTGHLVVTTMHAGSLTDVFADVFSATKAQSAAGRGRVGQRILAVIHLQLVTINYKEKSVSAVLPSLWRRSPASTAALVAAGIGSLSPHNPGLENKKRRYDCLGRQRFAEVLLDDGDLRSEFMDAARQLDLRGV